MGSSAVAGDVGDAVQRGQSKYHLLQRAGRHRASQNRVKVRRSIRRRIASCNRIRRRPWLAAIRKSRNATRNRALQRRHGVDWRASRRRHPGKEIGDKNHDRSLQKRPPKNVGFDLAIGPSSTTAKIVDRYHGRTEQQRVNLVEVVVVLFEDFCERLPMIAGGTAWHAGRDLLDRVVIVIDPQRHRGSVQHCVVGSSDAADRVARFGWRRQGSVAGSRDNPAHVELQFVQFVHRGFNAPRDDLQTAGDRCAGRDR